METPQQPENSIMETPRETINLNGVDYFIIRHEYKIIPNLPPKKIEEYEQDCFDNYKIALRWFNMPKTDPEWNYAKFVNARGHIGIWEQVSEFKIMRAARAAEAEASAR